MSSGPGVSKQVALIMSLMSMLLTHLLVGARCSGPMFIFFPFISLIFFSFLVDLAHALGPGRVKGSLVQGPAIRPSPRVWPVYSALP